MNSHTPPDEQALVEKILARMRSPEPGIPAEKVKRFLANVGEEIQRTGSLSKEYVDQLLLKIKSDASSQLL